MMLTVFKGDSMRDDTGQDVVLKCEEEIAKNYV
jgi:hypothetical protein